MAILRKYGVTLTGGTNISIPMLKAGLADFAVSADWTPLAGDVKVSVNDGAESNIATLPTYTNGAWLFTLSGNPELTGKRTRVKIVDSATKAVEDNFFDVETYGNASAMHPFDLGTATVGIGTGGIAAAAFAADTDVYTAKAWLVDDNTGTTDRWMAAWFKNGAPVTSGITVPTIEIVKASDASDLLAATAMTQIGALGAYKYDSASRVVDGAAYLVILAATIGGSARTWYQPMGVKS